MKKVAVTSYCGTGSSAVIDLLSEYSSCTTNGLIRYEHIPFYTPNGIFDLEDKLINGVDIHRTDEAIKSFKKEMNKLSKNNFGWFGSYEKMYGKEFNTLVDEFLSELNCFNIKGEWYGQYKGVRFSLIKVILQLGAKIIQNRKIHKWGRQYIISGNRKMVVSFPSEDEFCRAAKKFVKGYLDMIGQNLDKNIIYDHLVLPHNAYRIPNYFDDDFRLIIVDRDVRDMYALSTYVWPKIHSSAPFPKECNEFIEFWRRMKSCEKFIDDKRIFRLRFEDLVYNYEDTVRKIEEFIGLEANDHVNKKKLFDPEKSIKNTQNFTITDNLINDAKLIEDKLPEFVYEFPYEIRTSIEEAFDD